MDAEEGMRTRKFLDVLQQRRATKSLAKPQTSVRLQKYLDQSGKPVAFGSTDEARRAGRASKYRQCDPGTVPSRPSGDQGKPEHVPHAGGIHSRAQRVRRPSHTRHGQRRESSDRPTRYRRAKGETRRPINPAGREGISLVRKPQPSGETYPRTIFPLRSSCQGISRFTAYLGCRNRARFASRVRG